MEEEKLAGIITNIIKSVESLIPTYMNIEEDRINADGNVAICIIDNEGSFMVKHLAQIRLEEEKHIELRG